MNFWYKYGWTHNDMKVLVESRGVDVERNVSQLPDFGIVLGIPMTTTPVAAGFLRKVEGSKKTVILDSLITNKHIDADIRDKALQDLVHRLITWAIEHGISNILAFSTDENTLMRAKRFGFVELPHQLISLTLPS
jgi:hypothetical protein